MRAALTLFLGLLAGAANAHPAPNSTLRLEFRADAVHAEYWVPVSELAFARAADPAGEEFPAYLLRHFAVETPDGKAWRVSVNRVREADYLEHGGKARKTGRHARRPAVPRQASGRRGRPLSKCRGIRR